MTVSEGKIAIRQLTLSESDLNQIVKIENLSFNKYDAYHKDDFRRWLGYTPDLCLVAEIEDCIAGDMISRILDDKAELASLAIHPDFRRRGVGSVLLEETIRRVKAYGIDHIDLEVRKTNLAGFRFWKKMGFVLIGVQPGFYDDGETALQMRKTIK
ncbi:MAG: N-acetyltransferase [Pelolinea sp.]|nr:N-acetyltransferase [Pelolinea sp.]